MGKSQLGNEGINGKSEGSRAEGDEKFPPSPGSEKAVRELQLEQGIIK